MALRALGLGDLLTAVPALRALAAAFPAHERLLATPVRWASLLAATGVLGADGAVHRVVDAAPLAPLDASLHGPDVAVNLHGRGPQSTALVAATGPRRLVAFTSARCGRGVAWRAGEHEVQRWCRLLAGHGIPADPSDLRLAPPAGTAARDAALTVVHPGAASPARRWPPERWAAVARAELAAGRRVVVTGGPDEAALTARVAGLAPGAADRGGRTDEVGLAALVAGAGTVCCGDTGVAHLATAFGTPSVVLFGPTPPSEWGPPADGPHRVLWAGRRGDPHAPAPDPGLLEVSAADVLATLAGLRRAVALVGPAR